MTPPVAGEAEVLAPGALTRARRAHPGDAGAMAALINGFAARGLMLPKSPGDLHRAFREYVVLVDGGGAVVACGGLRVYSPALAEVVGLAVAEPHHGRGLGAEVVARLLDDARALGVSRVFAMTLQEPFFARLGFHAVPHAWLPEKLAADCRGCARRSGCREIAVVVDLDPTAPSPLPSRGASRPLRVVTDVGRAPSGVG